MENTRISIPMQFFAEPASDDAGATVQAETEPTGTAPQGEGQQKESTQTGKTFTQEELDKIVSERLAREQKKSASDIAELKKQFEMEKQEAAKLAKMNADEKAKYAAEKREQELTAREAEVQKKELRFEALNILEQDNLPAKLIGCVDLSSAETCKSSIEAIKEAWTEALSAAVDARLKPNTPLPYSGGNTQTDPFLEAFGA